MMGSRSYPFDRRLMEKFRRFVEKWEGIGQRIYRDRTIRNFVLNPLVNKCAHVSVTLRNVRFRV